MLIQHTFWR